MLTGVDRAAFAIAFAARLRAAGVPVGLTAVEHFVRALAASPPTALPRLYWTARISLVRRHSELAAFNAVFASVFDDPGRRPRSDVRRGAPPPPDAGAYASLPSAQADDLDGGGLPWMTLPPAVADAEPSDAALAIPERLPSAIEALADVPFENLDPGDMQLLGGWLESALKTWPTRRSRRTRADPAGSRVALRPTVARARRTGWAPI
jgi:uncharacterized protein